MNRNIQMLPSLNDGNKINSMTLSQKEQFINQIKKQSTYMLLNANRALESKDYTTAKSILIYIADCCSCIKNPDKQIQQILSICFQYLAVIRKKENQKTNNNNILVGLNINASYLKKKTNLIVLKYNKFLGQFQFDQCDKDKNNINKDVFFYVSKLNAILFAFQNIQSQHSIIVMFKTYSFAFLLSFLLTILLIASVFTQFLTDIFKVDERSIVSQLPVIVIGASFLIPLLLIYMKKPFQKDTNFFQLKLGQQIQKINKDCKKSGKKITFLIPQGAQLNIKVQQEKIIDPIGRMASDGQCFKPFGNAHI